jgi:hypothetical protein
LSPINPKKLSGNCLPEKMNDHFPRLSGISATEKQKGAYIIDDMVILQPLNIIS